MAKPHDEREKLREYLAECAKLYLTADLDSQRLAVASALYATAKYLEELQFPPETLLPLMRPATALADRENNALDEMFSQRPREGRPSLRTTAHMRTAILAVFANAWLKSHENDDRRQSTKLADAARKMRASGLNGVTGATLKTAREIVSRESKEHLAVEFSNRFAAFYAKVAESLGERRAFALMARYVGQHEINLALEILKTPSVLSVDND